MKSIKSITAAIALTATASIAQAGTFEIESATVTQLFSSTFDGLVFSKSVTDDGSFFGIVPDINNPTFGVNRSILVESTGDSTGSGSITFDGTELGLLSVQLPDLKLTIITGADATTGETLFLVTETAGAAIRLSDKNVTDGGDDANFDQGGPLSDNGLAELIDFSTFNNISAGAPGVVDTCVNASGYCGLLPSLNLDGVRWTLEGTPTTNGGDTFVLRGQTSNFSYYEITLETAAVVGKNVPAMGAFGLVALFGGLVAVAARLRRRVA
jgi:hypothetical protein